MMGFNIMSSSHFDEYLVDFTSFKPGPIDPAVFEAPSLCDKHHKHHQQGQQQQHLLTAQAVSAGSAVMPWARLSSSSSAVQQEQQQNEQQLKRLAAVAANAEYVANWNQASNAGFKLSLNRFADWLPEEYEMLRGRRSSSRSEQVKQVRHSSRLMLLGLNGSLPVQPVSRLNADENSRHPSTLLAGLALQ